MTDLPDPRRLAEAAIHRVLTDWFDPEVNPEPTTVTPDEITDLAARIGRELYGDPAEAQEA